MKHVLVRMAAMVAILSALGARFANAGTLYVDCLIGNDDNAGTSFEAPFRTIQRAIDVAQSNDLIRVNDGSYGAITATAKPVTIESVNGSAFCTINGNGSKSCAVLGTYDNRENAKLVGFTLRNGGGVYRGGGAQYGTLVNCQLVGNTTTSSGTGSGAYSSVLTNCVVASNTGTGSGSQGGGVVDCTLYDCVITNNSATAGGGAYNSTLYRCLVAGNSSTKYGGGGLYDCLAICCRIENNTSKDDGGGVCCGTLYNCLLRGNSCASATTSYGGYGGGADESKLINCTVTGNSAKRGGGGVSSSALQNCIVWGNSSTSGGTSTQNVSGGTLVSSCTTPFVAGEGNISDDPMFSDPASGDYTLRPDSPCRDVCRNVMPRSMTDLDGAIRCRNGKIDMGAYEIQEGAAPGDFPAVWFVRSGAEGGDGKSADSPFGEIQEALDVVGAGDEIRVAPGRYRPFNTYGGVVTVVADRGCEETVIDAALASGDPEWSGAPAATLGYESANDVSQAGMVFTNTMIRGFTLVNGSASDGAGVRGGWVFDCVISNNVAWSCGGGAYASRLVNCRLVGNSANQGGGAYGCSLDRCLVSGNEASQSGGGVYSGSVVNCMVVKNRAMMGAGLADASVESSTVVANVAAQQPAGVSGYGGASNSIIWGNMLDDGESLSNYDEASGFYASYCCTAPLPSYGTRCIADDPVLVETDDGAYALGYGSPCLDAGSASYAYQLGALDYYGNPRVQEGELDIGAAEGVSKAGTFAVIRADGHGRVSGTRKIEPGGYATLVAQDADPLHAFAGFFIDGEQVTEGVTDSGHRHVLRLKVDESVLVFAKFGAATLHVAPDGDDANVGSSRDAAKRTINGAVAAAWNGDRIVVADGVYDPFQFAKEGVFIEIESENGPSATIVDAKKAGRCVDATTPDGCKTNITVRGFTMRNGKASSSESGGGVMYGVYENCVISNCVAGYMGGGAYGATMFNCRVVGNSVGCEGGGTASSDLCNCIVASNRADKTGTSWSEGQGGGMYWGSAENCTIVGNFATTKGGGASGVKLRNCIVVGNAAQSSADVLPSSYQPLTVYTASGTVLDGEGNIVVTDAMFADGNYNLRAESPCVDAGGNDFVTQTLDINGVERIKNGVVDMGASEHFFKECRVEFDIGDHAARTGGGELVQIVTNWNSAVAPEIETTLPEWFFLGWDRRFENIVDDTTIHATFMRFAPGTVVLSGAVDEDMTLDAASVYVVWGALTVAEGATLTIPAGTVVKFMGGSSLLLADGAVCVCGGAVFTHVADDMVGGDTMEDGDATVPVTGGYTVDFRVADDRATDYRYFVRKCRGTVTGALEWRTGDTYLVDGVLTVSSGSTLTIPAGAVVKFTEGSELRVASGGLCVAEGAIFTHVADDTIGGDTMGDGDATQPEYGKYFVDAAVVDSDATEYRYPMPVSTSGTLSESSVWRARHVYCVEGTLTLASGVTLTIAPGAVVKFDAGAALVVGNGATLNAKGTRSQPIVFTSIKDDEHGGDTNEDGASSSPAPNDWRSVKVSGRATFDNVKMLYGGGVANSSDSGMLVGNGGGNISLSNCVLAHGMYDAIFSYAEITAENCALYDCDRGVNAAGGTVTMKNCVVDKCRWGVMAEGGAGRFYNCSITRFYGSTSWPTGYGVSLWSGGSLTVKNCNVWTDSASGQNYLRFSGTSCISADPRFVSADAGDFRLLADSPCIDAGDGAVAPKRDYFGQTRQTVYEDAKGTPDAKGNYPDIGIHEVMPREVKSDIDLAVESVSAPDKMVVGEKTTVSWTVRNLGSETASGAWVDKVELVCANGSVVEMETVTTSVTLPADGMRTFSGTFTVPSAQAGNVKVRVTANANRDIFEGTLTANNSAESETATLTMPALAFGDNGTASFNLAAGGSVGYRLGDGFAEGGLLIVHVASATAGGVKVWTGNGQVPTADIFYAAAVEVGGGDYLVRVPAGGDAYVAFANEGNGLAKVEVGTEAGEFLLFDTGVTTAPNDGTVSLMLYGNGFEDGMEVWLVGRGVPAAPQIHATDLAVFDPVKAVATFDVTGLAAGDYEVYVKKGGDEVSASLLALTQQKIGPKWSCKLDIASAIRSSREYVGYLEYSNTGDMPLDAPYVKITAGSGSFIRLGAADAWGDTLELMAVSETYPASQLKPGEKRRIPFRYKTTGSSLSVECGYTRDDPGAFPWDTNASYMRPSWANDEMWPKALAVLKANVGATWNDYLKRMREDLDFLAKNGIKTHRLERAWQMEINEALGVDHAVSTLASGTDLARSGRGFGLALTRSYGACLHQRLRKGMFGYGWSDGYGVTCELQESGQKFVVDSSSGSSYSFTKLSGSWQPEDARDKTRMAESSSEYVLTARSGMVVRFSKGNMRLKSVRDNMGNGIDFTYSGDQLTKVTHTDGQWISFAYSGGLCSSATDDQGRMVRYSYSGEMLSEVTAFNGRKVKYRYLATDSTPSSRALRQIEAPDGQTRDFTYDSQGRVATVSRNGSHFTTEIVRGEHGSYSIISPNGGETKVTVGAKGETLSTVNALGQTVKRTYTEETQLESVISPSGKRSKIEYDSDGQAVKTFDATGAETSFAYTSDFGALKSVTDAKRHAIEYGYDKKGRSESVAYPDETQSRIAYNDKGDVIRATNAKGVEIEYAYDDEGRKTSAVWPDGRTFAWEYDAKGNCTNASDSVTGEVTMEYDDKEQLTRITYPKGRGFTYEYDAYGRVTKRTMLGGSQFAATAADIQRYTYDSFGRVSRMTDGDGNLYVANAYDPVTGDLVTQTYGNGTVVSNSYDILGRIVSITHRNAAGDVLDAFLYDYNEDGQRIQVENRDGFEKYAYDAVGQLTRVTYPDGSNESFAYDAVGNRTSAGGAQFTATENYSVNNLNQYTSIAGGSPSSATAFTYDADGNLATRTDSTGTTRYYYNCEDRLVGVTNETTGVRWSCEYDVFGNRVMVDDNGTVTEKLYVQGSLPSAAAEFDGAGTIATHHILLGSTRLATLTTNHYPLTTKYYHSDGLASTRLLTDATGTVTARASYNAFGSIRSATGESISDGWVGTLGVERDSTRLLFMRNRYYDPAAGRFTQRDPIGHAAGDVNWYRYCGNEPMMSIDPFGLEETCKKVSANTSGGGGSVSINIGLTFVSIGTNKNGDWIYSEGVSAKPSFFISIGGTRNDKVGAELGTIYRTANFSERYKKQDEDWGIDTKSNNFLEDIAYNLWSTWYYANRDSHEWQPTGLP